MFIGYPITTHGSTAIEELTVNPITGQVQVKFLWGGRYTYEGISRRAILDLMANTDCSLGQWVNRHCLQRHITLTPGLLMN
jgi:hypothetical protein